MKKIFSLIAVTSLAAFSAMANPNDDLARMSHQVDLLITQNAAQFNLQQTAQVYDLLSRIQLTVGKPLPALPNQPPVTPQPYPFVACANDSPQLMQPTYESVKNFAYEANGLNLSAQDSVTYANQWSQHYACSAASAFIRDGLNIRQMAYEANGLNMSSQDAATYTEISLEHRCSSGTNFAQDAESYYTFAYSTTGMNMSAQDAATYARQKIDAKYFVCEGIHR